MISPNQPGPLITRYGNRIRQRGIVLPLVVIGLLAIIAMAGLAIDSSHAFVNKTRLQNMVDAAALSAAKEYDETTDTILSTVAANSNFGRNTNGSGNFEIDGAYDNGDISVIVQYSETLNPFVSTGIGPYVRVIAAGFSIQTGLAAVVGINSINIGASAVAGPSPTINFACNIAPLVVCAGEPPFEEGVDTDEYGFVKDALMVLKPSPGDHDDVGPGNYKLLRLECPGGACVRDAMAGGYEGCASTEEPVDTEPGVTAGPTSQGFNTRFNIYAGPISPEDYPPDVIIEATAPPLDTQQIEDPPGSGTMVDQICLGPCNDPVAPTNKVEYAWETGIFDYWGDYAPQTTNPSAAGHLAGGEQWRRVLAMPVANCTGDQTGQSTLDIIGFACYFMVQPIGGGQDKNIFGQFVKGCLAGGYSGMDPGAGTGPYVIQLYKDPDSIDS